MYTDLMQLEDELDEFLGDFGYQVVDLQHGGSGPSKVFRLFIDRLSTEPVTIKDCSMMAPQVILFLEMKEVYNDQSSLEVSSAGLDRVLKRDRDFERFLGSTVRVAFYEGSRKKSIIGELTSFTDDVLVITVGGSQPDKTANNKRKKNGSSSGRGNDLPQETIAVNIERERLVRVNLVPHLEI